MSELNLLQKRLLEMLEWFHKFCVENDITYYVAGGTMLGAARHQGFIPWDDDVDVVLPRKDYEKLLGLFDRRIDNYVIETSYSEAKDFRYSFSKFYDTTTTLVEHQGIDCKRGVYIDIFPLDGVGNTKDECMKNFKKVDRWNMFLMTRTCALRRERKFYKNMAIVGAKMLPSFLVDEKKIAQKVDQLSASFGYDKCKYVMNFASTYRFKEIMEKDIYGTPMEYTFENIKVLGVEKYEQYLTCLYGKWRELPPEEKRHSAHDFVYIDLQKSYFER